MNWGIENLTTGPASTPGRPMPGEMTSRRGGVVVTWGKDRTGSRIAPVQPASTA
ncbi:hypothetical protein [Microbispora triticiradicis]|uniref:hypothetical protein n=1 Tax=Microbispora TaxID=2005 RepID=UPI0014046C9B|nr:MULTISPECIES: hypothetical protein [Microbispora]GLW23148.1 hypothetical protein Mame01_31910 [Microbispora amethystogenes]